MLDLLDTVSCFILSQVRRAKILCDLFANDKDNYNLVLQYIRLKLLLWSKFCSRHDIAEILLKLALNTSQSINKIFICNQMHMKSNLHWRFCQSCQKVKKINSIHSLVHFVCDFPFEIFQKRFELKIGVQGTSFEKKNKYKLKKYVCNIWLKSIILKNA